MSAVAGGDAGGDSLARVDADGEGGGVGLLVVADHLGELEGGSAGGGERDTDQTTYYTELVFCCGIWGVECGPGFVDHVGHF